MVKSATTVRATNIEARITFAMGLLEIGCRINCDDPFYCGDCDKCGPMRRDGRGVK